MLTRQQQRVRAHAACSSVLNTAELLENILSNLDMRALLTCAQRVSRRWHRVIAGSPLLQRLLYLQPESQQSDDSNMVRNKLLEDVFPIWFNDCSQQKGDGKKLHRNAFTQLPMCRSASRKQAFMWPKASWRRMLVTQPPSVKLGCWMSEHTSGCFPDESDWQFKILEFPQGLRMGKLYDLCLQWVASGSGNNLNFNVYWTPKDYETLHSFYWLKVWPPGYEALRICGTAVDVIVRGERWTSFGKDPSPKDRRFAKRFACSDTTGRQELEPARDSGYKSARQWATELDPFYSAK